MGNSIFSSFREREGKSASSAAGVSSSRHAAATLTVPNTPSKSRRSILPYNNTPVESNWPCRAHRHFARHPCRERRLDPLKPHALVFPRFGRFTALPVMKRDSAASTPLEIGGLSTDDQHCYFVRHGRVTIPRNWYFTRQHQSARLGIPIQTVPLGISSCYSKFRFGKSIGSHEI